MGAPPYSITDLRARLDGRDAPTLWRSLDAVADTPAFRHFVEAEFPAAARLADGPDRRRFLKLMAASFAMAGLAACEPHDGRSMEVPYVRTPERIEPGMALSYASATLLDGIANGVLLTTRNGRPLKVEGNPQHPWSRGGTDVFAQAAILDLYDPARSQTVRNLNRISTWGAFRGAMTGRFAALKAGDGEGLALLTGPLTSPTLLAQFAAMQAAFPQMRVFAHEVVARRPLYEATVRVFGRPLETRWDFAKADVVVALDGDMLDAGPHQIATSRAFTDARRARAADGRLLELHAAATTPTLTSAKADRHIAIDAGDLASLLAALTTAIDTPPSAAGDARSAWLAQAAAALGAARGRSVVMAGITAPVDVHAAVHRLNVALGNVGQTVTFTQAVLPATDPLDGLVSAMREGSVSTLLMLDVDPVYTGGADLGFTEALDRVPLKIHAGAYVDATAAHADWHLPLAHPFEAWGDARSLDGTVTLIQPTVAPLYGGRSASEIVSLLAEAQPREGRAILEDHWRGQQEPAAFQARWRQALVDGFIASSAFPLEVVTSGAAAPAPQPATARSPGLDVVFRPDATVWDGRFGNNGWLQELPKPLTKMTWENAIAISPALAERQKLAQGDVVTLTVADRSLVAPVWILPGQGPNTVTLTLGYGSPVPDMLASGLGYDAFRLRSAAAPWHLTGGTLLKTGGRVRFATTQDHSTLEGHDLIRVHPVGSATGAETVGTLPSLYPPEGVTPKDDDGRAWGMVIDEDACIGCNACVVACQSENNIPVVGREEVAVGREMHWLRIDRYYSGLKGGGGLDDPDTHFQPVPCMHCEDAPCEVGCPVEATVHDHEGLNLMVYNRCVGTRACSGYCPYKVRHFNYLDYTDEAPALSAMRNPEVSVRAKGVMEKCTYCVQRIAEARITADKGNTTIPDGAVQTACQGACPTQAITFGDLKTPNSMVALARSDPRNYALLGELNLRPRTTYLAERGTAVAPGSPAAKG